MKRSTFLPVFFLCLGITFCLILFSKSGAIGFLQNEYLQFTFPIGGFLTNAIYQKSTPNSELNKLKQQNQNLTEQLVQLKILADDNKALRDQFQNQSISSKNLLPARIVGEPNVIPNVTFPDYFIIDKGNKDGIKNGMAVIVKDNLVGIISETSSNFSKLILLTAVVVNFPVKDYVTNAKGILRGQENGELSLDNVLLSDSLNKEDNIITLGSQDLQGIGIPPDLIVGKIVNIDKNPSSLFQKAKVAPLISLENLSMVFVVMYK